MRPAHSDTPRHSGGDTRARRGSHTHTDALHPGSAVSNDNASACSYAYDCNAGCACSYANSHTCARDCNAGHACFNTDYYANAYIQPHACSCPNPNGCPGHTRGTAGHPGNRQSRDPEFP